MRRHWYGPNVSSLLIIHQYGRKILQPNIRVPFLTLHTLHTKPWEFTIP